MKEMERNEVITFYYFPPFPTWLRDAAPFPDTTIIQLPLRFCNDRSHKQQLSVLFFVRLCSCERCTLLPAAANRPNGTADLATGAG
jgi:hypothetical protein